MDVGYFADVSEIYSASMEETFLEHRYLKLIESIVLSECMWLYYGATYEALLELTAEHISNFYFAL
jgi:hypothetical protein